jgi:hypothetical protein
MSSSTTTSPLPLFRLADDGGSSTDLGEQTIRDLLRDRQAGTPKRELAERYGISVSSVMRILRH